MSRELQRIDYTNECPMFCVIRADHVGQWDREIRGRLVCTCPNKRRSFCELIVSKQISQQFKYLCCHLCSIAHYARDKMLHIVDRVSPRAWEPRVQEGLETEPTKELKALHTCHLSQSVCMNCSLTNRVDLSEGNMQSDAAKMK